MAGLDDVLGWLKGTPAQPSLGLEKAPPLTAYPSNDDAANAQKYGFGYGTGNEPYLNNETTRVLGHEVPNVEFKKGKPVAGKPIFMQDGTSDVLRGLPDRSSDSLMLAVNDPKNSGNIYGVDNAPVANVMMKAALSANRSPIAALGFDPDKVVLDSQSGGKKYTLGGAYLPTPNSTTDNMYVNLSQPDGSTIVHESTHRGFQKLRDAYPEQVAKILKNFPDEETTVRWLMNKNAGDPEKQDPEAKIALRQRQQGIDAFNTVMPSLQKERAAGLDQLEYLASEAKKNRRPGGPR